MAREDVLRVKLVADGAGQVKAEMLGVEQGLSRLEDRGRKASDAMNMMRTAIAAVSVGALGVVFKTVVDGADKINKMSQATGVAVEELTALQHAAALNDVQLNTLGTSLQRLAKNATDTKNGTGEAKDAFKALGIEVADANGRVRGTSDILLDVADKFAGLEDGSEKTAIAMRIFGDAGAQMVPLLNQGRAGIQELTDEARALGLVFDEDLAASSTLFNDSMTRAGGALRGALIQSMREIIPLMADMADGFVRWVQESDAVNGAAMVLGGTFKFLAQTGNIVGLIFQQIGTTLGAVAAAIVQVAAGEFRAAGTILSELFTDLNKQSEAALNRIDKLWGRAELGPGPAARETKVYNTVLTETGERAKKAEKALEALEKKRAAAHASIEDQIDALVLEQYQLTLSAREREIFKELLKAENVARAAGIDLTDEQREAIERETAALYDQNAAIEARKEAEKAATKAAEDAAKERAKLAEQEAEAMRRPFEQAAENIQSALSDGIYDGLNGNIPTINDFFETFKRIAFRAIAEIAAAMVFRPQLVGIAGMGAGGAAQAGVPGAGGGGGFSLTSLLGGNSIGMGFQGFGDFLFRNTSLPVGGLLEAGQYSNLAYGAAGVLGGLGANLVFGGKGYSSAGGSIGATIGMAAGGPIGAAIGSLIGGGLGSLFGNKKPSDKTQAGSVDLTTGGLFNLHGLSGKKFSQENADFRDQVLTQAAQIAQALQQATGGTLNRQLYVAIGNRDGLRFSLNGDPTTNVGNDVDALMAGIVRSMVNNLEGVDAELRAVFGRLDFGNLEQALLDIQTAAQILGTDFSGERLSAAAQAVREINAGFDAIIADAGRLGLSTARIEAARQRELAQLTGDFNRSVSDAILAITDPLEAALQAHARQAEERLQNARDLGANLVELERLTALERERILEQHGGQQAQAFSDNIRQFLLQLRGGGAFLSSELTLANAQTDFDSLLAAARGGDAFAQSNLTAAASNLINASRAQFGSSEQFFERLGFIERTLQNVAGIGGESGFELLGRTVAIGNDAVVHELQQVTDQVIALKNVVATQQAALDRLLSA